MFEDYLQDAFAFFELAKYVEDEDERQARMYYRAAVFCAASSLEAFVNFIGDTFEKGESLDPIERAFLNDRVLEVSPTKGLTESRTKYQSIDSKIKYILKRFSVPINPATSVEWNVFLQFKDFRDALVHPRLDSDEITLQNYRKMITTGLNAYIEIMNAISKTLFTKPLRTSLLDLRILQHQA